MPNGEQFTLPPRDRIERVIDYRVSLEPSIHLKSNINKCASGTLAACGDQCVADQFLNHCHCVPWHMLHLVKNGTCMCDGPCKDATVLEHCIQNCEKSFQHPCDMILFRVGHMFLNKSVNTILPIGEWQTERIQLYIPEAYSFIEATAEHEMSPNAFFSMLGGSIEFWGMITIPALLHCFIYLISHCRKTDVQPQPCSQVMDVDAVGEELENSVAELRKSLTKVHWWYWLKDSSFYRETPLIGYGYISAAASYVEAVFWYMVIMAFAIMAIVNLQNVIDRFASSSTHLILTPTLKSQPFHLPNLTIELNLPICELTSRAFKLEPMYDPNVVVSFGQLQKLSKTATEHPSSAFSEAQPHRLAVITEHLNQLLATESWNELISDGPEEEYERSLSNPNTLKEWDRIFTFISEAFSDIANNRNSYSPMELQQKIPNLDHLPFAYGDRDELLLKLILLHGVKHGSLAFTDLVLHKNVTSILEKLGWQPRKLLASTINSLARIVQFNASASGVKVLLTDFNIEWGSRFQLGFRIVIPPGLQQLEMSVVTLMHRWNTEIKDHTTRQALLIGKDAILKDRLTLLHSLEQFRISADYWYTADWFFLIFKPPSLAHPYTLQANTQKLQIPINKNWQWESAGEEDCQDFETQNMFHENCIKDLYLDVCQCIPWFMIDDYESWQQTICIEPCRPINKNICQDRCQKKCRENSVELGKEAVVGNVHKDQILSFRLYTNQKLHMKLVEHYDLTKGKFLAELGGLLEFWLGLNIFVILHAFVHLIKWRFASKKRVNKKQTNDTAKLVYLCQKEQEFVNLKLEVVKSLSKLRTAAQVGSLRTPPRYGWLRKNRFFDQTPLTGFSFISAAKSKWEVGFWYLAMTVFSIITVHNVYSAISYYRSKPTKISTNIVTDDQILPVANLSLSFILPMSEFVGKVIANRKQRSKMKSVADEFICGLDHFTDDISSNEYIRAAMMPMVYAWEDISTWKLIYTTVSQQNSDLSNERNLQLWQEQFEKAASLILELFERNEEMVAKAFDIAEMPMLRFADYGCVSFHMLEFFKTGIWPRTSIDQVFDLEIWAEPSEHQQHMLIKRFLNGSSPLQLWKQVQHHLSKTIHVRIVGVEGARVLLEDWAYGPTKDESMVKLRVMIPAGTRLSKLNVQMRSYAQTWHKYLFDTIYNYYMSIGRTQQVLCDDMTIGDIRNMQVLKFIINRWTQLVMDNYNYNVEEIRSQLDAVINHMHPLTIETDMTNAMTVKPFRHYNIFPHPSVKLISKIDGCFDGSYAQCAMQCESDAFMESCGCVPWTLLHVQERDACAKPCTRKLEMSECKQECERRLRHPCMATIYDMTTQAKDTTTDLIYSFSIDTPKERKQVLMYEVEYDLTIGSFVSHLGGLLDLWVGLNLLSFTHLIVYIYKLIREMLSKKSNNRETADKVVATKEWHLDRVDALEKNLEQQMRIFASELEDKKTAIMNKVKI